MQVGTRAGIDARYSIVRRLAVGGMAEIYLAKVAAAEGIERLVVLKRLLPHLAEDPAGARMFHDEARIAATLRHPNIVQLFDVVQTPRETFICMEYLEGGTLEAIGRELARARRPLPLDLAVQIAIGAAAGLDHAHRQTDAAGRSLGIIHRDVSPANVFVTYDGAVKVIDFGIAKAARRRTQTEAGGLKGKLRYMAPEQARGGEVDARADVYSLCATLWELVGGSERLPEVDDHVLLGVVAAGPPVPAAGPRCRAELVPLLARGLAPDPARRWATTHDLLLALEELARSMMLDLSSRKLGGFVRELVPAGGEANRGEAKETRRFLPNLAHGGGEVARASEPAPIEPAASRPPAPRRAARLVAVLVATSALSALAIGAARGDFAFPDPAPEPAPATSPSPAPAPAPATSPAPAPAPAPAPEPEPEPAPAPAPEPEPAPEAAPAPAPEAAPAPVAAAAPARAPKRTAAAPARRTRPGRRVARRPAARRPTPTSTATATSTSTSTPTSTPTPTPAPPRPPVTRPAADDPDALFDPEPHAPR